MRKTQWKDMERKNIPPEETRPHQLCCLRNSVFLVGKGHQAAFGSLFS